MPVSRQSTMLGLAGICLTTGQWDCNCCGSKGVGSYCLVRKKQWSRFFPTSSVYLLEKK